MTNPNEVKPCPFCGGEASSSGVARYSDSHEAWFADGTRITEAFYCNCMVCGVSNRGLCGHQTQEKAITAWNTRSATSDAADAPPPVAGDAQSVQLTADEKSELAKLLRETGHDDRDFEAECPLCTAYEKLTNPSKQEGT